MTIEKLTERINERGVKVNVLALNKKIQEYKDKENALSSSLIKKVSTALGIGQKYININSTKLMVEFFYGYHSIPVTAVTGKTKMPSLAREVLEPFASSNEDVAEYIEYRSTSKNLGILLNLQKEVTFGDEIHTNFNCNGAISGRFTSTAPNLQQIPGEFRRFFIPRKDFTFVSIDIHQAEPALSYQLANAPVPSDIYETNAAVLGITRDQAKTFNIGVSYGMTVFGIAKLLKCSKQTAQRYLDAWKANNKELCAYINKVNSNATKTGSVSIYDGSLTVKDDFSATEDGYQSSRAFNIHIQGSVAKLLKRAMLNIQNLLDEESPNSHIVLTEHDELVIEVADKDVERLTPQLERLMMHIDRFDFTVKTNVGKSWQK